MTNLFKKHGKILAVIVLIAIAGTLAPMALNGYNSTAAGMSGFSEDDRKIAVDISNTTGFSVEEVLALKRQGKTWNEVLERLKLEGGNTGDRDEREARLLQDTLEKEDIEAFMKEGYTQEEIMEAKLLVERVLFQLQQISEQGGLAEIAPKAEVISPGAAEENPPEDISAYTALMEKIEESIAVKLMLRLKMAFGSLGKVFDEYLFALQADMNLEDYLLDMTVYMEKKAEKTMAMGGQEVITMAVIEEKLLKKIQALNKNVAPGSTEIPENPVKPELSVLREDMPKAPVPVMEDVRPRNPAEEVMNELKQISPVDNLR